MVAYNRWLLDLGTLVHGAVLSKILSMSDASNGDPRSWVEAQET